MTPADCCPHCGDDLPVPPRPCCPSESCKWVRCAHCKTVINPSGGHACPAPGSCNARLPRGRWSL